MTASARAPAMPTGKSFDQAFAVLTREHVGKKPLVSVDGKVVSAPVVRESIPGGVVRIALPARRVGRDLSSFARLSYAFYEPEERREAVRRLECAVG